MFLLKEQKKTILFNLFGPPPHLKFRWYCFVDVHVLQINLFDWKDPTHYMIYTAFIPLFLKIVPVWKQHAFYLF